MSQKELSQPFDFSKDEKKTEAHWNRDKNLRDIFIHLYEWHKLLLNWIDSNIKGNEKPFLPAQYNWKTYSKMNIEFLKKHQNTSLNNSRKLFKKSHKDIINLAKNFTDEELFSKGIYKWVGASTLGFYFVSATSSHYDWAIKKLKAHIRECKTNCVNPKI